MTRARRVQHGSNYHRGAGERKERFGLLADKLSKLAGGAFSSVPQGGTYSAVRTPGGGRKSGNERKPGTRDRQRGPSSSQCKVRGARAAPILVLRSMS